MNEVKETVTQVSDTVSKIVRSRTCGCKDIHVALITENTSTQYLAEIPQKLARAIKIKIDEKWTSEKIYSDDETEEVITSYEGTDVELEINALAPQDRAIVFGQLYKHGYLVKNANDRAPEVAIGWRERKLNGKYEFKWLYIGKFAEGISEEANTKEGKLSPTTKSIKGSFYERALDGKYEISVDESNLVTEDTDAATALKNWFSAVQEYPDAADVDNGETGDPQGGEEPQA
jgi:phi13 family phage major tail protein